MAADLAPDLAVEDDGALGPRAARAAAERRRRRRRLAAGGVLVVLAAGIGAFLVLGGDDDGERPVGKLVSSDLTGAEPADASTTTLADDGATTAPTSGGDDGDGTPTTAPTGTTGEGQLSPKAVWPGISRGRPAAFGEDSAPAPDTAELEPGYYLFLDLAGWHLWVVGDVGDSSIELVADDVLARADAVGDVDLQVEGNRFRVAPGGGDGVRGVDFQNGFYGRTMIVSVDGDATLRLGRNTTTAGAVTGLQRNRENR